MRTSVRFEQVLLLPGHRSSVWGLDVAADGSFCLSAGQDRSLRMWTRGDDLVFVEEERERAMEHDVDRAAAAAAATTTVYPGDAAGAVQPLDGSAPLLGAPAGGGEDGSAGAGAGAVAAASIDSVRSGEALMDALDLVEAELAAAAARNAVATARHRPNPVLLGLDPHRYLLRALRMIKAPDLEQALLVLPFHYVSRLVPRLLALARAGLDVELCARCAVFLLRCHTNRITHTAALTDEVLALRGVLRGAVGGYRTLVGTNVAALRYLTKALNDRKTAYTTDYEQLLAPYEGSAGPATNANGGSSSGKKKKGKNKRPSAGGAESAKRPRK